LSPITLHQLSLHPYRFFLYTKWWMVNLSNHKVEQRMSGLVCNSQACQHIFLR
jgi:hypothetical protein